jgi:penicillin V acylase-like amidase (Ntn superfamily)
MAKRPLIPRPPGPAAAYGRAPSRRKAAPTTAQSIRVQLTGCRTIEEIAAMIDDALHILAEANIPKASSINLYLTPKDADGQPLVTRTKIPDLVIDKVPAYRSAAEHYKVP